jgi:hypothetical protein
MKLPRLLKQLLLQCCLYTALCLGLELVLRSVFGWRFPYDYPADPFPSIFGDFRFVIRNYAHFHSRQFFDGLYLTYPAPALVPDKLFLPAAAVHHRALATAAFLLFILAVSWVMLVAVYRALVERGLTRGSARLLLAGLYLTSFPFWFEFHQANVEVVVWAVLSLGVWAHWTGRSWAAAVCFGCATAMKLFPLVFLGLLVARRQYRQLAVGLGAAVLITAASLWLVCPNMAYSWRATIASMRQMGPGYLLTPAVSGFDHTLFGLLKRCLPLRSPAALSRLLAIYMAGAALLGTLLYSARIRKLPVTNQVLCLTVACVLLPPVSFDYTLVHLYAPLVLLVFVVMSGPQPYPKPLIAVFALLAFLLSAQSEFIWHGARFGGQLKAVSLLALFVMGLIYPFEMGPVPHPAGGAERA